MKKVKNIVLGVTAVLAVAVLAVLALAWVTSSFSVKPSTGRAPEETYRLQAEDFSIEIPASYEMKSLAGSLRWPGGYIIFRENWVPDQGQNKTSFGQLGRQALANGGRDVSEYMGQPAFVRYRDYDDKLGLWQPVVFVSVLFPHSRVDFSQMASGPLANPAVLDEEFLSRVRDFLPAYTPDGAAPEASDGLRTFYGTVTPQSRKDYVYSIDSATFFAGQDSIYIAHIPDEERQVRRPGFTGKIGRFFSELDRTGLIPGTGLQNMTIDSRPGHEVLKKHPFFDEGEFIFEMEWAGEPQAYLGHKHSFLLVRIVNNVSKANQGDIYADWLTLLNSLKFEPPTDMED